MNKCTCDLCERNRSWKEQGVPSEIIDYVLSLEMSEEYYQAVMDGTWPSGKEVLQRALNKYKEEEGK